MHQARTASSAVSVRGHQTMLINGKHQAAERRRSRGLALQDRRLSLFEVQEGESMAEQDKSVEENVPRATTGSKSP